MPEFFHHDHERQLLAGLIQGPPGWLDDAVREGVSPTTFTRTEHREVFKARAAAELNGGSRSVEIVSRLRDSGGLDLAGGIDYVMRVSQTAYDDDEILVLIRELVALEQARTYRDSLRPETHAALEEIEDQAAPALRPITASELARTTLPPIESFVGEAALPRGQVAMLHGKGGLGKSYIAIGLGICLATETPWLGLPVRKARTLMLSYEIPAAVAKMQVNEWCAALGVAPPADFLLITMEQLFTALLEPNAGDEKSAPRDRLVELVRRYKADVLILDPWRSCHHAEEQDSRAMSELMESLKIVAAEAQVAVQILHHDRKGTPGKGEDESSDSARGSTAMRDAARSVARLHRSKGALCLEYHKVNLGSKPEPIWLDPQDHAPPRVADAPEVESARGRRKRKTQVEDLLRAHPDGATLEVVMSQLRVSRETARRYLMELQVRNLRPLGDVGLYVLKGGRSDAD